jgi:bis(5'-nucleosyl)-tetraphosphatase (symmetrical)
MATYAIGDVQGCLDPLQRLLDVIHFDPAQDYLWFTGDLVNRGPQSLETLRFIRELGDRQICVLGNHDLHLLVRAHDGHNGQADDTLDSILTAPDRVALLRWLLARPLLHHDPVTGYVMAHAGLAPGWTLQQAKQLAAEVEAVLQGSGHGEFLRDLYGDEPSLWRDDLQGQARLRCIVNYFTRMRFCDAAGRLVWVDKAAPAVMPWFQVPQRKNGAVKIIFGHWAALAGQTHTENVFALDTGCVWGYNLTAMRLEDGKRFQVGCG